MELTVVLDLIAFAILMSFSAFFSSSETALFSLNRVQLEQMRREGDSKVHLIERLLSQPRHLIVTILIGNEFVNVAASVISASLVIHVMGAQGKWMNLLIMVPVLLLVGEITPKTLAIRNNRAFARFQCRPIDLFSRAITPLRLVIRRIADLFITMLVGKERSQANLLTEDMVRSLANEAVGQGVLDSEEAQYIHRIFDFSERELHDIMTPRSRVFFLSAAASPAEAAEAYRRTGHTKIPVYRGSRDAVIGVFYVRDLLGVDFEGDGPVDPQGVIAPLLREPFFVPETKSVADLFYTFRKRKRSLALTVDEYGGVTGLVTMEDLLECIFGEIISHSERLRHRTVKIQELDEHRLQIDGTMTVDRLNRALGSQFTTESAETIGGMLLEAFGELPAKDRRIVIDGYEFAVVSVVGRRIAEVAVEPVAVPEAAASAADGTGPAGQAETDSKAAAGD